MSAEQEYIAARRIQQKAITVGTAISKLSDTANKLQFQDYTHFKSLNPYGKTPNRKRALTEFESKERNRRIVQRIKTRSLPGLRELAESIDLKSEYWNSLPIWIQLKYERMHGPVNSPSLRSVEQGFSLPHGILSRFEKGKAPARKEIVQAYGTVLGLDENRTTTLINKIESEKGGRKRQALRDKFLRESTKDADTLGSWMSQKRRSMGLTQFQLGEEIGTSREVVSAIESNNGSFLYEETIIKLLRMQSISIPRHLFPEWFHTPSYKGEYLRSLRVQHGVSIREFVEKSGRMRESVVNSEKHMSPAKSTIELYEKILGVKIVFPSFD